MKASECKCIVCNKPAVAFWPVIDPDIPSRPYCRECLDKAKLEALVKVFGEEDGKMIFKYTKAKNSNENTHRH